MKFLPPLRRSPLPSYIHADNPKADMWSGFVAVFVVNLIIAAYVVMAFWEDDEPKGAAEAGGGRPARPGVAGSKERTD